MKLIKKQSNLLKELNDKLRLRPKASKKKKSINDTSENINALYQGQELTLNAFKSGIFPLKTIQWKGLKILTPKQILQRLPIALSQVKAGNTSENLLTKSGKSYILCIKQKKLLKWCITI